MDSRPGNRDAIRDFLVSRRARLTQCFTGHRLVAWAAPGAIAISGRCCPTPACASQVPAWASASALRKNSGGPPSGCTSRFTAASKYRSGTGTCSP